MTSGSSSSQQAAVAKVGVGFGGQLLSGFSRRSIVAVAIGAAVGFSIGVASHALWRAAVDRYNIRNEADRLIRELENLKRELSDVRQMLYINDSRMSKSNQLVCLTSDCRKLLSRLVKRINVRNVIILCPFLVPFFAQTVWLSYWLVLVKSSHPFRFLLFLAKYDINPPFVNYSIFLLV